MDKKSTTTKKTGDSKEIVAQVQEQKITQKKAAVKVAKTETATKTKKVSAVAKTKTKTSAVAKPAPAESAATQPTPAAAKVEATAKVSTANQPAAVAAKAEAPAKAATKEAATEAAAPVKEAVPAVKVIPAVEPPVMTGPAPKTMAELLATTNYHPVVPHKGEKIKGRIILKNDKMLKVDLGAKTEGIVAESEFTFAKDYIFELKVGDEVTATVLSVENSRNQVILSLKSAASEAKWEYFEEALDKETTLEAKGIEVNKGGLIVMINGIQGFVPSSQFSRRYVGNIEQLKNKKIEVKAIEVDRERNRLIFSERHVSEAKQLAQRGQALDVVKEGDVYEGVISGVKPFGLFMTVEVPIKAAQAAGVAVTTGQKLPADNIGYVEGLIHISEISWEKVDHPKNYHQVGDRVKVKVLGVDENSGKLNLSIKRLAEDPWQKVANEFPVGTTFTGKVSRIAAFGVFVNVMSGVDGLIHATKLDPSVNLKEGDSVTVNVDSIEPDKRRMSLSLVLTEVPLGYK